MWLKDPIETAQKPARVKSAPIDRTSDMVGSIHAHSQSAVAVICNYFVRVVV
jgi:hypothetical protein